MTKNVISIINYKAGNAPSVSNALRYLNIPCRFVSTPGQLEKSQKLILPGVGSAKATMNSLGEMDLIGVLKKKVLNEKTPFLGICIGHQILFDHSEEGNTGCLGWLKGKVVKFDKKKVRVPHIGWNEVKFSKKHRLISGLQDSEFFYFVNSYYVVPDNKEIVFGETKYGVDFCSALLWRNILSTQFHVEKSGPVGLRLLKNFAEMDQGKLC